MVEFVAGWHIAQVLGEGAYGEVKLLIEEETQEAVAMKIVDLIKHPDAVDAVAKEMALHRMLKHENVLKFYGSRKDNNKQYMFLEYVAGGELYDQIEPDVGMKEEDASKYFKELMSGVEYIHSLGVTHRDIKPENLLLSQTHVLKICDFGMATLFRYNGRERLLDRKCGTKPYIAPEVLIRPYSAEPADIWSCGVVLVALIAGALPWDEPTLECREFERWHKKDNELIRSPWRQMDPVVLALLKRMLNVTPKSRITLEGIKKSAWFNRKFNEPVSVAGPSGVAPPRKRVCSYDLGHPNLSLDGDRIALSQPAPQTSTEQSSPHKMNPIFSFSQPANPEHLLLSSQMSPPTQSQQGKQTSLQRQVKRMTRVMVNTNMEDTIKALEATFTKFKFTYQRLIENVITIKTIDSRNTNLIYKASLLDMGAHILVDFRLSKGCGLDFKRQFMKIKQDLSSIVVKGPVTWSIALATNTLPS